MQPCILKGKSTRNMCEKVHPLCSLIHDVTLGNEKSLSAIYVNEYLLFSRVISEVQFTIMVTVI